MAGDAKKLQPIIIKRVKKGGHAAHGGAWKIAYADFVTAMMAFFLMMWLIGSTTEGDRKGIADYFSTPLKLTMLGGGSGAGDASSVVKGGGEDFTRSAGQVKRGDVEAPTRSVNLQALKAEQARAERARLEKLKEDIERKIDSNEKLKALKSQIRLDMTREGLRIQIVDANNRPMFASGSAVVQPYMRDLLQEIGTLLTEVPNRLTLEGHTDSQAFGNGVLGYTNWELSSDRANASRRELMVGGLPETRVMRVQGLAASVPFDKNDPVAPVNRRISIIVMNRDAEDRVAQGDGPEPAAANAASAPAAPAAPAVTAAPAKAPTAAPAATPIAPATR
ncbi:MAG: flagellar motor protein MotB [Rubrivivax sp.]|jgi:chemotaxis protein MotB|nr:flagellar motor protein MotB [Rubrivivax sp.]